MIYIATPYSHELESVQISRFNAVNKYAAELISRGEVVFSPISHSHPVAEYLEDCPNDWDFWEKHDLPILGICSDIHVLCLPGWEESKGVHEEIVEAKRLGINISFINPEKESIV